MDNRQRNDGQATDSPLTFYGQPVDKALGCFPPVYSLLYMFIIHPRILTKLLKFIDPMPPNPLT